MLARWSPAHGRSTLGYDDCDGFAWTGFVDGLRTLMATSTACVLLTIPTTTEPCFTASAAYSTWNILPCGELEAISIRAGSVAQAEAYNVTESLS